MCKLPVVCISSAHKMQLSPDTFQISISAYYIKLKSGSDFGRRCWPRRRCSGTVQYSPFLFCFTWIFHSAVSSRFLKLNYTRNKAPKEISSGSLPRPLNLDANLLIFFIWADSGTFGRTSCNGIMKREELHCTSRYKLLWKDERNVVGE